MLLHISLILKHSTSNENPLQHIILQRVGNAGSGGGGIGEWESLHLVRIYAADSGD